MVEILGSVLGDGLAALAREELLHLLRQLLKLCDRLVVLLLFHRAERLAKRKADHVEHCELRRIGLCRRNGDLGARLGVEHVIRLTRDGRADHVDDGEDVAAALFRLAQRGHGIERFARLGDDNDKGLIVHDGVAVAEFGREHDLDIAAQQMLEIVLADHADMIRRAAGHNENAGKFTHLLNGELEIVEDDPAVLDARGDRAAQRLGLLHDLLEHEVLVAALLGSLDVPRDAGDGLLHGLSGAVKDGITVGTHLGELTVVEIDHIFRVRHERRHVGGEEVLTRADADDQRAAVAREEHLVRAIGAQDADRIAALQTAKCLHDGVLQVAVAGIIHIQQVHNDLRVRLAMEPEPLSLQHLAQLHEVFDDAVLHDGELAVIAHVRVGIRLRRRAVRCPARMAEADIAVKVATVMRFGQQILDLAAGLGKLDRAAALGEPVFAFDVEAYDRDGNVVFSDIASIRFDSTGAKSVIIDNIPAGSRVIVKEVYAAGSYQVTSSDSIETQIVAGETADVDFTNDYNDKLIYSTGVVNHFEYDGTGWEWVQN